MLYQPLPRLREQSPNNEKATRPRYLRAPARTWRESADRLWLRRETLEPAYEDREAFSAPAMAALREVDHWQGEPPLQRRDGEIRTVSLTKSRIERNSETSTQLVILFNDITEYRKISESRRQISLAVEQSPESIQMPNLDGIDATHAIRGLPCHQHTPILALTENAFAEDRMACLDPGMNDHIGKPVDPDRLSRFWKDGCAPCTQHAPSDHSVRHES